MPEKSKEAHSNVMSITNKKFVQLVADYGNEKLGHIWEFTQEDVIKVLHALSGLAETEGKPIAPKDPNFIGNYLEWFEPEDSKRPSFGYRFLAWAS